MARRNKPTDLWQHVDMHGGDKSVCWEWQQVPGGAKGRGKQRAYFSINSKKRMVTHLIFEMMHGRPIKAGHYINHTCDNSICCNPAHLYEGTHAENTEDMVSRDRHGLPSHVVRRIRVLLSRGGQTHKEIAELYAVDRSIVTRINNDKLHTHENDYPTQEDHDDTKT